MGWQLILSHSPESHCDTGIAIQVSNWEESEARKKAEDLEDVIWESFRSFVARQLLKEPSSFQRKSSYLLVLEDRKGGLR